MAKTVIGITDCAKYNNYAQWILEAENTEVIRLQPGSGDILRCQGVILTGGQDVHPRFYGKEEYLPYSDPSDLAEERDVFELLVIEKALQQQIPLLGICRGLQITNVYLQGTLVPDLPRWGKFNHSRIDAQTDRQHGLIVDPHSMLQRITGIETGQSYCINSAHHQSADKPGNGLIVSAMAPDGTAECMEWQHPTTHFLLLVQWHPERMTDRNINPLAIRVRHAFLEAAASFTPVYTSV